jgi:hypothetical protein
MATPAERKERIARIAALPDALAAFVAGLNDAQLDALGDDDPWTVRQVTHHVADSHMNAFIRMKLMLTEQHPTLRPYDQDAWALLPDTRTMPVDATLALLRGLHARWVRLLESLGDDDWSRGAYHPENGEVTLDGILATYAQHGEDHVAQIKRILARVSASGDASA